MSYEAVGPKGTKIRIEIPGGDLTNAKIVNTASGEELDNVVEIKVSGNINEPGAQAEVWLRVVDVDIVMEAMLKDYEVVSAGVIRQMSLLEPGADFHELLSAPEAKALEDAMAETERKRKTFVVDTNFQVKPDDSIVQKMYDETCRCSRCKEAWVENGD